MIIGVDFDNTIIRYDRLFHTLAVEQGLLPADTPCDKTVIRDRTRALPQGEIAWQKLQAEAYGPRIGEGEAMPGVETFFALCRQAGIPVRIVSHKTRFAAQDTAGCDMRQAAMGWLRSRGFLAPGPGGLAESDVFFEETRQGKINRLVALGCTHFVDDLEETFLEPCFPPTVAKILLAPGEGGSVRCPAHLARSWAEVSALVFPPPPETLNGAALFAGLLGEEPAAVERLGSGGNSRVFRLRMADGRILAGKVYHDDGRNRLQVEYAALSFLWEHGLRETPQPVAMDPQHNVAAYRLLPGAPITPESVGEPDLDAAVDFLLRVNQRAGAPAATGLPPASEACFSGQALLDNIAMRLDRLHRVESDGPEYMQLRDFLDKDLGAAFAAFSQAAREGYAALGRGFDQPLDQTERILSPSDFGFHNALRQPDGGIAWLDFEYFGWDDPAKTVCDFLLHPAMNLPPGLMRHWWARTMRDLSRAGDLPERTRLLYPLYGIKWGCILLNEFVLKDRGRRLFAGGREAGGREARERQLAKARNMLNRIKEHHDHPPF